MWVAARLRALFGFSVYAFSFLAFCASAHCLIYAAVRIRLPRLDRYEDEPFDRAQSLVTLYNKVDAGSKKGL